MKLETFHVEQAREILPVAPIAAHHDVLVGRHRLDRDVMQLHRARQPFGAAEMAHDTLAALR